MNPQLFCRAAVFVKRPAIMTTTIRFVGAPERKILMNAYDNFNIILFIFSVTAAAAAADVVDLDTTPSSTMTMPRHGEWANNSALNSRAVVFFRYFASRCILNTIYIYFNFLFKHCYSFYQLTHFQHNCMRAHTVSRGFHRLRAVQTVSVRGAAAVSDDE